MVDQKENCENLQWSRGNQLP